MTQPAQQQPSAPPASAFPGAGYGNSYGYPPGGQWPTGTFAPVGPPLAEFSQRLVAYVIDGLIVGAVLLIPMLLLLGGLFVPYLSSLDPGTPPDLMLMLLLDSVAFVVFALLNLIASYVYFVGMCHRTGQTIGKRVMKIRIVRQADAGPIDLRMARRRWVVQHVTAVIAFYFAIADGLWQLWDRPYRQCLHDKCAETVVVQVAP